MFRILVFGMTENPGGVESFLMNYFRHIDKSKIQFDFLCNSHEFIAYEEEIRSSGSRIFHITARSKHWKKYSKELKKVFAGHASEWDAIWVNVCSLANIDYLKMAKKYGITKRIIHSHNSQNMDSWLRGILHKWNRLCLAGYATDFWACSENAARWFYGGKTLLKAEIIHNAISVRYMRFHEKKRNDIREKYGWQNNYVIGNVGRLHFQKNQSFALEVFARYYMMHSESILVLVGQGEDEQMLKNKAKKLGISNKVFFVGAQDDIQAWLSAFDLFLFPSKFEGLSIAALEAEANSISVLAAKKVIPQEIKINDNFVFYDLDAGVEAWSIKIDEVRKLDRESYTSVRQNFIKNGYDIEIEAGKLQTLLTKQSGEIV